jgi:protein phosphatase
MAVNAAGHTSVGHVRERNEDQFLVAAVERSLRVCASSVGGADGAWRPTSSDATLLMVADGMGGQGGGDVASNVAIRAVTQYLCGAIPRLGVARSRGQSDSVPGVRGELERAVAQGDAQVRRAAQNGAAPRMGTTLTLAYIMFPTLYVAHVGDSRCYLMRAGTLSQLTDDHTVAEQLRRDGRIEVGERSELHHVLYNALGGGGDSHAEPQVRRVLLHPDDCLLLCSDGITKHLVDTEIGAILDRERDPQRAVRELVRQADDRGGSDNSTAVVARCTLR